MRYYLTCIFLCGMFFQSFSISAPKKADSLFMAGQYFEAAIEYERLYYYSDNYREKNECKYQKALCYKQLGNYNSAQNELDRLALYGLKPAEQLRFIYQKALVSYLNEDFTQCNRALISLQKHSPDSLMKKNILLLEVLNNIMLNHLEESKTKALEYARFSYGENQQEDIMARVEYLYSKKELPKLKSEKVFEWVSIVPGFGQMYVGKVGEGLGNIGLNLAAFSFGVLQIINGYYATGYFVGTLSINKFYFGGRTRAKNLFKQTNQERKIEYHDKIKHYLLAQ